MIMPYINIWHNLCQEYIPLPSIPSRPWTGCDRTYLLGKMRKLSLGLQQLMFFEKSKLPIP